jgi:cell division protein FtsA
VLGKLHTALSGGGSAKTAGVAVAMKDRVLAGKAQTAVGLEIGRFGVRCVVCALEGESFHFLGCGMAESKGWNRSRVHDQQAIAESVRQAVQDAESSAGVPVPAAVVGVAGMTLRGENIRSVYEFRRPREVESEDLGYAADMASRVRLEEDRYLLQVLPQDYTVDGRAGFRNPCGAVVKRLEANVHLITVSRQDHQALVHAVQQAHVGVEETVFEAVASAYSAILPGERERGVALADVSAHTTSLAIYDGDALVLASSLPVGGEHFTRDVAHCLPASLDDARRLKEEFGCAILGLTSDSVLIDVPSPDGRPPRAVPRRLLNEILEARARELFEMVLGEIHRSGMAQDLLEGLVLTGGGAILNGMCDVAEQVLNCQARIGLPVGIDGWPDDINDPAWTTAAGLAMWSGRLKFRRQPKRRAPDLLKLILK